MKAKFIVAVLLFAQTASAYTVNWQKVDEDIRRLHEPTNSPHRNADRAYDQRWNPDARSERDYNGSGTADLWDKVDRDIDERFGSNARDRRGQCPSCRSGDTAPVVIPARRATTEPATAIQTRKQTDPASRKLVCQYILSQYGEIDDRYTRTCWGGEMVTDCKSKECKAGRAKFDVYFNVNLTLDSRVMNRHIGRATIATDDQVTNLQFYIVNH